MTRVAVLTPAGSGAIATVAIEGPQAWAAARVLFRPARGTLPEQPALHRFWFGTIADGDEVVLAVREADRVEVHCHGGQRVVRWVVEQFIALGGTESESDSTKPTRSNGWAGAALELMTRTTTTRTAAILLDQYHGAFESALHDPSQLEALRCRIPLGRHLVAPWRVVLAGPPNAGKSSLLNALAGFQRSVVSATAGTTRDVVTVPAAFDGWPVELADTAGLRRAAESIEQAGIDRARQFLANADLVVWLLDASEAKPELPADDVPLRRLVVLNKCDLLTGPPAVPADLRVSAKTGEGVPELAAAIAQRLVPDPPPTGAGVPFLPEHEAMLAGSPS